MSGRPGDATEEWAVAHAVEALGATDNYPRDTNIGQQMRDFHLVFADGHYEPLEVTTYASDPRVKTILRSQEIGLELPANVNRLWAVSPHTGLRHGKQTVAYDVRRLARELPIG